MGARPGISWTSSPSTMRGRPLCSTSWSARTGPGSSYGVEASRLVRDDIAENVEATIDLAAGIAIGLSDIHDDIVFSGPDPGKTD